MEYIGERTDETGAGVSEWLFSQTQFRYYVSALFDQPKKVFMDIEWQLWINKLGDPETDENVAQFLLGYRFQMYIDYERNK